MKGWDQERLNRQKLDFSPLELPIIQLDSDLVILYLLMMVVEICVSFRWLMA